MDNVYLIENCGSEGVTRGIAVLSDDDFAKFKEIIENLNKNSCYIGMPVIEVYKVKMNDFKECNLAAKPYDDDYTDAPEVFYFGDKTYTFKDEYYHCRYCDKVI